MTRHTTSPVPSTLGYALLGLLPRRPRTGYELTRALRDPVGHFWTASHSQIYPELARLEADGLVRHRVIDGPGPRDTKQFRVTAAGRRALADWVARPPGRTAERDEFLLKVYSLWAARPEAARALVETHRSEHIAARATYRDIDAAMRDEHPVALDDPATPQFSAYATLCRGLSFEDHVITWCDWLLAFLNPP
jgi:DNA-binding PadR family transcriptional regulator